MSPYFCCLNNWVHFRHTKNADVGKLLEKAESFCTTQVNYKFPGGWEGEVEVPQNVRNGTLSRQYGQQEPPTENVEQTFKSLLLRTYTSNNLCNTVCNYIVVLVVLTQNQERVACPPRLVATMGDPRSATIKDINEKSGNTRPWIRVTTKA